MYTHFFFYVYHEVKNLRCTALDYKLLSGRSFFAFFITYPHGACHVAGAQQMVVSEQTNRICLNSQELEAAVTALPSLICEKGHS